MPRFIDENDDKKLEKFYGESYGSHHIINNPEHHNWQFKNNPFNKSKKKSVIIEEIDKNIASHIGLFPIELKFFENIENGTWYISVFTSKNYRRMGLLDRLVKFSQELFDFTMGLSASEDATKIYIKNGWTDLGNLNRHIAILDKSRVERFLNYNINKDEINIQNIPQSKFLRINEFDEKYDEFWLKVQKRYSLTVNRTREYLSWRYFKHPFINYHVIGLWNDNDDLVGYTVLRIEDNNVQLKAGRIIDLIVFEDYEIQLVNEVIRYLHGIVDFVDFFCTGNFYKKTLEQLNFFNDLTDRINLPLTYNPIDLNRNTTLNFLFKCNNTMMNDSRLYDINSWYFVKGDSDLDRAN